MKIDWNRDRLTEVEYVLGRAQKLCSTQCFGEPTTERRDRILELCKESKDKLVELIFDLIHAELDKCPQPEPRDSV